jgi:hypothetical protein
VARKSFESIHLAFPKFTLDLPSTQLWLPAARDSSRAGSIAVALRSVDGGGYGAAVFDVPAVRPVAGAAAREEEVRAAVAVRVSAAEVEAQVPNSSLRELRRDKRRDFVLADATLASSRAAVARSRWATSIY